MSEPIRINSASNRKLKALAELQKKGRLRREQQCFAAEGRHLLEEAPPDRLRAVYMSRSFCEREGGSLTDLACPCYVVEDALFARVSDTKTPQGVISVVGMVSPDEEALLQTESPLCLLLDQISDPGNLGTIIRAGEAVGVSALFLSPGCADPYQPKVVRSAMGALYRVPIIAIGDEDGLWRRLKQFRERGIRLYGTDLQASIPYDAPDYTGGSAFVIGNESRGVSGEILDCCDERLIIPMLGQVESLNAAVAATVLLFEAARQRRG